MEALSLRAGVEPGGVSRGLLGEPSMAILVLGLTPATAQNSPGYLFVAPGGVSVAVLHTLDRHDGYVVEHAAVTAVGQGFFHDSFHDLPSSAAAQVA